MVKINYESDFSLKEVIKDDKFRVPFVFTYMVGKTSYVASWDGENTVNCKINEDGSVTVIFDKHGLEVGKLRVRREFFIPDENFPDGVCNMVSVDNTDIILVEGATEGTEVEDVFTPPYIGGGTIVAVEVVDNLESTDADKALSANMGRVLSEAIKHVDVPTKTSQLTNDSGFLTEIPEGIGNTPIIQQTNTFVEIQPDVLNVWGEVASLTLNLAPTEDTEVVHEYMFQFTSGATPTTLTLPSGIKWATAPSIKENKTYQISIINNLAVIGEWSDERV